MLFRTVGLESPGFRVQFSALMNELGDQVPPWLKDFRSLPYSTKPRYVRDKLLLGLKCEDEQDIRPFQCVTPDVSRQYVGGVILFTRSPDQFRDRRNLAIAEQLKFDRSQYCSCLHVRDSFRSQVNKNELIRKYLRDMLDVHRGLWGVVARLELLDWYRRYLGASVLSPDENIDGRWIVSWKK